MVGYEQLGWAPEKYRTPTFADLYSAQMTRRIADTVVGGGLWLKRLIAALAARC
jgi:hypothetical protein